MAEANLEKLAKTAVDAALDFEYEGKTIREWIKELKAYKEQEPCEDAISRQDVIQECKAEFLNTNVQRQTERQTLIDQSFARGWNACNRQWMNEVLQLPSAQKERKKGKWVDIKKDGNRIYRCRCSECGKNPIEYTYGYEDWWFEELPKFCPDCGTEMENLQKLEDAGELRFRWQKEKAKWDAERIGEE
jgi:hypothetical protein